MNQKQLIDLKKHDVFPQELTKLTGFLIWEQKRDKNGKFYKAPINSKGIPTDHKEQSIHMRFADVVNSLKNLESSRYGLAISQSKEGTPISCDGRDGYLHILDLDGFVNENSMLGLGNEIAEKCGLSYMEVSPSGVGCKIFVVSDLEPFGKTVFKLAPNEWALENPEINKYSTSHGIEWFTKDFFNTITLDVWNSKTTSTLRFVPKDELLKLWDYINSIAIKTIGQRPETLAERKKTRQVTKASEVIKTSYRIPTIECLEKTILPKIDNQDEQTWSTVANIIARLYGEIGRGIFDNYSEGIYNDKPYSNYDPIDTEDRFDRALKELETHPDGVGMPRLLELAGLENHEIQFKTTLTSLSFIDTFNKEYFVAPEGSNTFVFHEGWDHGLNQPRLVRRTFDAFNKLNTKKIYVSKYIKKLISQLWLESPRRREYLGGLILAPQNNVPSDVYNLWKGFGVDPFKGDTELILSFIKEIICNGSQANYDYLIKWAAYCVQYPERQAEVAVVCRGLKGSGKSTLGELMRSLFGKHGLTVSQRSHLTGHFNGHLRDTVFLLVEEAFFAGNKEDGGVLKDLITGEKLMIEQKGVDTYPVKNRLKILMTSNNDWVVPASADERRYFCLDVSAKYKDNRQYWDNLYLYLDKGGREAFLEYLLAVDLSKFKIRNVPNTQELNNQKIESFGVIEAAFYEWLEEGNIDDGDTRYEWTTDKEVRVPCKHLIAGVYAHEKAKRLFNKPSKKSIGSKVINIFNARKRQIGNAKEWSYFFPPLGKARDLFEKSQNLTKLIWSEGAIGNEIDIKLKEETYASAVE